MTTKWHDTNRDGWGLNTGELFNVILVYEDQTGAQCGLALYQRLMSELGIACEFNLGVWKSAVLVLARLGEITTEQAAAADLVIVCTRSGSGTMQQVRAWSDRWLELKGRNDCALVVLGEAAEDSSAPIRQGGFFDRLARRGVASFASAATTGCAARGDGRAWLPRHSARSGVDGWFPDDPRHSAASLNQAFPQNR